MRKAQWIGYFHGNLRDCSGIGWFPLSHLQKRIHFFHHESISTDASARRFQVFFLRSSPFRLSVIPWGSWMRISECMYLVKRSSNEWNNRELYEMRQNFRKTKDSKRKTEVSTHVESQFFWNVEKQNPWICLQTVAEMMRTKNNLWRECLTCGIETTDWYQFSNRWKCPSSGYVRVVLVICAR